MWPASVSRANARARVGRSGGAESRESADRTVNETSVAVNHGGLAPKHWAMQEAITRVLVIGALPAVRAIYLYRIKLPPPTRSKLAKLRAAGLVPDPTPPLLVLGIVSALANAYRRAVFRNTTRAAGPEVLFQFVLGTAGYPAHICSALVTESSTRRDMVLVDAVDNRELGCVEKTLAWLMQAGNLVSSQDRR